MVLAFDEIRIKEDLVFNRDGDIGGFGDMHKLIKLELLRGRAR